MTDPKKPTSRQGKWRDKSIERLSRAESPTYFEGKEDIQKKIAPQDQPNWDVFELRLKGKDDEPILISGNDAAIMLQTSLLKAVDQLLEIRGMGGGGGFKNKFVISNKGKPQVFLNFYEKPEDVKPDYEPLEGHISFRLNEYEDWSKEGENLSLANIESLAKRIAQEFLLPTPYKWQKGRDTVSYWDKENGFESWGYFQNKIEGLAIYEKACRVAQLTFIKSKLKHTQTEDAVLAFPDIPPKRNVFGQEARGIRKRGLGNVYFSDAYLSLSSLKKPILLVNSKGFVFNSKDFNIDSYIKPVLATAS